MPPAAHVAAGDKHALVSATDGRGYSLGFNSHGQLGLGDWATRDTMLVDPKFIPALKGATHLAARGDHSLVAATGTDVKSGRKKATADPKPGEDHEANRKRQFRPAYGEESGLPSTLWQY